EMRARDHVVRREARARDVATGQPRGRDAGEEVLVAVRQPFALGGEALVAEALEEVASRERRGGFLGFRIVAPLRKTLEPGDVEIQGRGRLEAQRVLLRLEPGIGLETGRGEAREGEPQGLTQGRSGRTVDIRPELRGDRVTEAGSRTQGEEGGQRLGGTTSDADRDAAREKLAAAEKLER